MEDNINSIEGEPVTCGLSVAPKVESRVAYFKRMIASGQYKVDPTRLASAMMDAGVVESGRSIH